MQVDTPEISYHNDIKPILAVDLHPSGRMATGGADHMVRVWQLHKSNDSTPSSDSPMAPASSTSLTFLANLEFHQQPVNAVRFSPDGKYLASASDGQKKQKPRGWRGEETHVTGIVRWVCVCFLLTLLSCVLPPLRRPLGCHLAARRHG